MAEPPRTRPSLLIRIRDARDAEAWQQFVKLYAPLVYGFARKRGLQDCDAADLTQDVLRAVSGAAARLDYDPKKGSFRGWLFTVVRHKLQNLQASQRRQLQARGETGMHALLEEQAAPEAGEVALWDQEYERQLLARAVDEVRGSFQESSWRAFWQTAMEGKKAKELAPSLGMSVAAVYMAKSRVMAQLKECIRRLQEE
jgi:RNA polymerase sigma-70 factor (ECF subfamily)